MKVLLRVLLCTLCLTTLPVLPLYSASALEFKVAWQANSKGGYSAPNCLRDAASGKTLSLVVSEKNVGIVCLGLDGQRKWEYPLTPPVTSPPAVADVDGDGVEDVVGADSKGHLVVLRADGTCLWKAQLNGGVTAASSPAVADIDGDNRPEILIGDKSGTLSCLDNTGKLRWRFSGDGGQTAPVLVADIYDTPGKEIVMPSHDRCIYVLSARGEWLWDLYFPTDLFPNSNPILADVDGDNIPELYVGGGLHHFYRIDLAKGSLAFEENVYMHINGAMAAADLDGVGGDEVVFGTKAGAAYLYGKEGIRWKREMGRGSFQSAPMLFALENGAQMAALFFQLEGDAFVFDAAGKTLAEAKGLPCHAELSAPLAGDLDNDGQMEVLVSTANTDKDAAALFCLKLGVPYHDDPRNRLVFAQDRAHTGRSPGAADYPLLPVPPKSAAPAGDTSTAAMKPFGETLLLSGPNTWRFDVTNAAQRRLVMLLELQDPSGSVQRFARHIRETNDRATFTSSVESPGTYKVSERLIDADRRVELASVQETRSFEGVESDKTYLEALFAKTEDVATKWAERNLSSARAVRQTLAGQRGALAALCAHESDDRTAQLATLRTDAVRLNALVSAGFELAPAGSFAAWASSPWGYFDPRGTLPASEKKTERLSLALCGGEYGSLALNVTNMTGNTLDVRVLCDELKRVGAPADTKTGDPASAVSHIEFRKTVMTSTTNREWVGDALPKLDEAQILSVSSWETQQLWITVNTEGLTPGDYVADLRLKSVESDPTEVHVPIHLTVYDLALPKPRPLRVCTWPFNEGELSTQDEVALKDLVRHGETVFMGSAPLATCDANGQLIGTLDFVKHDIYVKRLTSHGMILFLSPQGGLTGQPFLSESWKKAFVLYLRAWVTHLKELGIGYEKWALYPYDEPSAPYGETAQNLVAVAKLAREADPNILIYTDPTSGTTMETVKMFTGLVDIWQPSTELMERLGTELLPEVHRIGKEVWFYDAAGGAKTLSSLGMYRERFWRAWRQGFTGVGWWVYSMHGADRWDGPNVTGEFYASVYEGADGPITSKRWEASLEGIQDYERLFLLRQAITEAEQRGVSAADLDAAKKLIADLPGKVDDVLQRTGRRMPLTPDSVPLYEQATHTVNEARREIVETCLRIKALPGNATQSGSP